MRILLLLLIIISAVLTACQTVSGSGNVISEEREVASFSGISLDSFGDLILTQAEEQSVLIEAEDNVLPYITTQVRNGVLEIGTQDNVSIHTNKSARYIISTPNIEDLIITGSGTISAESINGDNLSLEIDGSGEIFLGAVDANQVNSHIAGSGDIKIEGTTTTQKITIDGSGNYKAFNLTAEATVVNITGSGEVEVWTTELLSVEIDGSGDVRYQGRPKIDESIAGSGTLAQISE